MADHVREQITVAALARVTGLTTTGANVFRDRDTDEQPLSDAELPGLEVEDDGEPAERITVDVSGVLERVMTLRLTAHIKALTGYSARMNLILKEIEIAMAGASSIGGAKDWQLIEVSARQKHDGAERPLVRQSFTYRFTYFTTSSAPDVAL